ncbi:hypothetical protein BCUN_1548 [Bifidobacterium cuniculi]|uniref:Uncharacterized protein n=1 Tax=Bifidobacterium cuniculi TaxID=1688 RepID=A0A087ALY1_9BIFI|nr:hypothetical protein BCUN_1548 [Bifidobacterium cuniculi]
MGDLPQRGLGFPPRPCAYAKSPAPRGAGDRSIQAIRLLALVASLTQQFAVLLLAHPLAALLDDRAHLKPPFLVLESLQLDQLYTAETTLCRPGRAGRLTCSD